MKWSYRLPNGRAIAYVKKCQRPESANADQAAVICAGNPRSLSVNVDIHVETRLAIHIDVNGRRTVDIHVHWRRRVGSDVDIAAGPAGQSRGGEQQHRKWS